MPAGRVARLLPLLVLATGCSTFRDFSDRMSESARTLVSHSYHDSDAEAKMAKAEELFAANDFAAARPIYSGLADNTRNPLLLSEKARFKEAECYRFAKKYPKAVDTYHRLLQDHQTGAYRRAACKEIFDIADFWLDDTRAEIESARAGEKKPWIRLPKWSDLTDGRKPSVRSYPDASGDP